MSSTQHIPGAQSMAVMTSKKGWEKEGRKVKWQSGSFYCINRVPNFQDLMPDGLKGS